MGVPYGEMIVSVFASTASPGPNNILLLSSSSRHGLKKCLPLEAGIMTGLLTVMLLVGLACGLLGQFVPQIIPVARFIGAAYILYLAWKLIRKPPAGEASAEDKPLTFVNGFLLQFLNLKIMMLGIANYSGFIMPHGFSLRSSLLFAVCMTFCAVSGNLIWATVGSVLYPLYRRHSKFVNIVMGLLLVWAAWKILNI